MYKVLIIDADVNELNTLSCIVNWEDCGLEVAGRLSNSQQALRFLEKQRVDILIMNVCLPQMDGIALLQQIRSRKLDVRCIFLASCEDFSYVQKAIPLGIENFLLKPVDPQILWETLHTTVQKIRQAHTQKLQPVSDLHMLEPDPSRSFPPLMINQTFEKLMLNREYKQCLAYVDDLFSDTSPSAGMTPMALRNHIVELVVYVLNLLRSYNIDVTKIVGDDSAVFSQIISFHDMKDLHLWMKGFLTTSIESLENKNTRFSPCIARTVAHIEKNYAQDISLKTMANDLNINAAYLGQLFKVETGQLFSAFLNKTRIENAKKMLLNTSLTLSEVSQQCGYTNISYFYNIFKKFTGQTPSQYRKTKAK